MQYIFIFATFLSTFLGGLVGLKFRDKLQTLLGFTAGVILGVIAFDLFPEIIDLTQQTGLSSTMPMLALVIAFLIFHIAEKTILIHHSHEEAYGPHTHPHVGVGQALALAGHSFLDGAAIGLGFQVSAATGVLVAVAVIAHDFSDGLNTVALMLRHKNTERRALWFLFVDAIAPVVGGFSTFFWTFSSPTLLMYLGFFTGFLLYIGVADILPEAHNHNSSWKTLIATVCGVAFIFIVTRFL
jgi:zinc transporter ZupT